MNLPWNKGPLSAQEEQWAQELSQENAFADLSLEEIRGTIRHNPRGGNRSFCRDRLRVYRSLRNWLRKRYDSKVSLEIISAIILANPGLVRTEYDLLVELYEKQQPEQISYNVVCVARTYDGTIVYLTETQLDHALEGHEQEFGNPDKGDFANMCMKLLQRNPDSFSGKQTGLYNKV